MSAKPPSLSEVIGAAAFAISLITGWFYLAGWVYAYSYFDAFRIPLLLAQIPREHIFVYGGLTIWKNPSSAAGILLLAVIISVLCIRYRVALGRSWLAAIVIGCVIALFALAMVTGFHTSSRDVAAQRSNDYFAYPRVLVEFRSEDLESEAREGVVEGCARLVLATSDRLFLIVPRRSVPALQLSTIVLPQGDIAAITISGLYTSCT